MSFEDRLQQALTETGLSQSELARRVGASQQTVNVWCTGVIPRRDKLEKLPGILGRPVYWFFMTDAEAVAYQEKKSSNVVLDEQQAKVLKLFARLPRAAKDDFVNLLELKVAECQDLLRELLEIEETTPKI